MGKRKLSGRCEAGGSDMSVGDCRRWGIDQAFGLPLPEQVSDMLASNSRRDSIAFGHSQGDFRLGQSKFEQLPDNTRGLIIEAQLLRALVE
nr:hypothetical protein [Sphingopyxis macrogoltabida]